MVAAACWVGTRLLVGAACVATVLSLAQLFLHLLIGFYATIPPYAGVG
jgi:hypothetical protein